MRKPIGISIHAEDALVRLGMHELLRHRPEVRLYDQPDHPGVTVPIVCVDVIDQSALATIRTLSPDGAPRTVLVVGRMYEAHLLAAIERGVVSLVRRQEAKPDALIRAIQVADCGAGELPADLLGELLTRVGQARRAGGPEAAAAPGFSDREWDIVKLIADGLDTHEIAVELNYSERAVKNVLHGLMHRLRLRNRAHAVGYAAHRGYL
jgi:DNA-binding NarL/FixJ family response regulator